MAQRKSIAWILEFASKLPEEEQVKCLQANDVEPIRIVLQYCFHPAAVWALPPGKPPYKPCEYPNVENMLYAEARKMHIFLEGSSNINQLKREKMFIDLLESITPEDAKLLISIKDKKLPFEGLKPETIKKAYPGIF
ncbi:hypothetical protein UFOVP447_145 [uncultured Caudovirales phage]|uniref:Uncharacterized protein n=1 Tax=uncultured Caudovirales phage TaxID=2100421 RepID=A0A6J5M9L3_9CAUD|nr:hypothetical protein UFOVP447_145 [uncultured Caudovirales phage]